MATNDERRAAILKSWPYRADPPQRYWDNYFRYLERGGLVHLEDDIRGFASGGNTSDLARFYSFCLAFDQIAKEEIPGDFLELGAYKGNTASLIASCARKLGRTAYILDTFEGFSEADLVGIDRGLPIQFKDTSLDAVKQLVGEERTVFVKGYFPESATQLDPATQYALVHIDCDLYAPMTSALKYFYPRLAPGGYFFIHDYTSLSWQGAERAVDDFFADKAEAGVSLPDGAGTIVVRKARRGGVDSNWLFDKQSRLLSSQWNYAANGGLSPLLTHGWSGPEPWGVWAIGNVSEVTFVRELNWTVPFVIEFDVAMALMNTRGSETIEVAVDGVHRCVWTFTTEANRGTRSVDIFGESGITLRREMKVRFQIGSVLRPDLVNPEATDIREIGLGLYGVRKIGVKT